MQKLNSQTSFIDFKPTLKILVVDDDHCILKLYKMMTDRWKMDLALTCVDNCAAAVDYLKEQSPDILILDLNLNGADGREVVRYLQGDVQHQAVKVVVVSGKMVNERDPSEGMPGGVVYMPKPVDFGELKSLAMDLA